MDSEFLVAVRESIGSPGSFYVGGVLRDLELGRPIRDIDIVCYEPEKSAHNLYRRLGKSVFELSKRYGVWRVVIEGDVTVDFVLIRGSIKEDLFLRDFTVNAMARDVFTGDIIDPANGLSDLRQGILRAVSEDVFNDDPLRILRAVRLEDELSLSLELRTEMLIREQSSLVVCPAGERVLAELERLTLLGFLRLGDLGVLAELGGTTDRLERLGHDAPSAVLLVTALGDQLLKLPVSRELARLTQTLLRVLPLQAYDARSVHRFRRATEPWSVEALQYLGNAEAIQYILKARESESDSPLLRGDELDLPPGPRVGQILELLEEERAVGNIVTRDEALAFVARYLQ